jgi:hypothetical protein
MPTGFSNPAEPNGLNGDEDCLLLLTDEARWAGRWFDTSCMDTWRAAVEYESSIATQGRHDESAVSTNCTADAVSS